jgi:hypothetical protein
MCQAVNPALSNGHSTGIGRFPTSSKSSASCSLITDRKSVSSLTQLPIDIFNFVRVASRLKQINSRRMATPPSRKSPSTPKHSVQRALRSIASRDLTRLHHMASLCNEFETKANNHNASGWAKRLPSASADLAPPPIYLEVIAGFRRKCLHYRL